MEEVNQEAAGAGKGCAAAPAPGNTAWIDQERALPELLGRRRGEGQEQVQIPCTKGADCSRNSSTEAPGDLHTPSVQAPRQHARELCNMPHLQGTLAMGRSRMDIGWLLLQVITASTVFLNNNGRFDPITTELQPEHLPLQGSKAKKKCAPKTKSLQTSGYQPVMQSGVIRSRPPSMTSPAAGHGLQPEEMQDHDLLLEEHAVWPQRHWAL